ncbi:unnamed protein product [Ceratitis capitata]|uniref:(Mediterranean fruit fly) hypothetical protein n=1 Tax=Ceratitis capitata TaxID=7213 RepID=A0A811UJP8_CERCA|nr:unnamed protein product [Ceratitis capitata]
MNCQQMFIVRSYADRNAASKSTRHPAQLGLGQLQLLEGSINAWRVTAGGEEGLQAAAFILARIAAQRTNEPVRCLSACPFRLNAEKLNR